MADDHDSSCRTLLRAVAAVLIFLSLNAEQSGLWFTFAPIPDVTKEYYQMGDFELNFLANWGPIMYLIVMPMAGKMAASPGGTYRVAILGVNLCFFSTLLRMLSQLVVTANWLQRGVVHLAAMINACGGPLAMGTVSQAAADYVPLKFQSTAVGVMYLGQNLGNAMQGLLSPALARDVNTMHRVSVAQVAISGGILCSTVVFLPRPQVELNPVRTGPSLAAEPPSEVLTYRHIAKSRHMWILLCCGVLTAGIIAGQGALLSQFLTLRAPKFRSFTDIAAGRANFAQSLMLCSGNVLGGILADACCSQRLSWLACAAKGCSAVMILLLALSVPLSDGTAPAFPNVPQGVVTGIVALQGLFDGICDPLNYLLAALVTYPAPSALSAAVMTWAFNFACLVVLSLVPLMGSAALANWIVLGTNLVAAVSYLLLQEGRHRQRALAAPCSSKARDTTTSVGASHLLLEELQPTEE